MPASHPFNPLALLRLAVATAPQGLPNRYVCECIFRHVWQGGGEATDPSRLQALQASLQPAADPGDARVKQRLTTLTEQALGEGLFGVPAYGVDGKLFWGFDALPMLRAYLTGQPGLADTAWAQVRNIPVGAARKV
jgi:2-hydroxychromene-2-carboxylate isomerase